MAANVAACANELYRPIASARTALVTIATCGVRKFGCTRPSTDGSSPCIAIEYSTRGIINVKPVSHP
jgi:hypothetical protein